MLANMGSCKTAAVECPWYSLLVPFGSTSSRHRHTFPLVWVPSSVIGISRLVRMA